MSEESSRGCSSRAQGSRTVKVLPLPSTLCTETCRPAACKLLDDGEAQARAGVFAGHGVAAGATVRPWRNFSKIVCWSSSAMPTPVSLTCMTRKFSLVAGDADGDAAALGRELDGVGEEVVEDLLDAGLVLLHRRQIGRELRLHVDVFLLGQRPGHVALRATTWLTRKSLSRMSILPLSILARSRMSLIISRSVRPDFWMFCT